MIFQYRYMLTLILLLANHPVFSQLQALSDEFNAVELNATWNLFQPEYFTTPVPVNDGMMQIELDEVLCNQTCVWWVDMSAGLIYKSVTGDFDVTTAVYAKQQSVPEHDVQHWTQLAGLMARDPASTSTGNENHVFNVAGVRFDHPSIELKSTSNNISTIRAFTDNMNGTAAELRMRRDGSLFSLYSRVIGDNRWVFRESFSRPDLPETLQVGLIAYVFDAYPGNLVAFFDYIRFNDLIYKDSFEQSGAWLLKWQLNATPQSKYKDPAHGYTCRDIVGCLHSLIC